MSSIKLSSVCQAPPDTAAAPAQRPAVGSQRRAATEAASTKPAYLSYIHSFRGLAILSVVAGHCLTLFDWENAGTLGRALDIVLKNGTVYFVFIAGYLFHHLSGGYRFVEYMKKKVKNVIVPYLIMSTPAVVVFTFLVRPAALGEAFYQHGVSWRLITFYTTGVYLSGYWFISMIAVFYLLSPLLIYWIRRKHLHWLVFLYLGASFCVDRGDFKEKCVYFFSIYLVGMLFSHYRERVFQKTCRHLPLLLGVTLGCVLVELLVVQQRTGPINLLQKLALCPILLLALDRSHRFVGRPLGFLGTVSFGLYFVHPYVLVALRVCATALITGSLVEWDEDQLFGKGNVPACLASVALVVGLSSVLVVAAKRLFGRHSRLILGT